MNDIHIRPITRADVRTLDRFRYAYTAADLEIPKGYTGEGHETVVAEKNGQIIGALTGTLVVVLDPLIKNPDASPLEVQKALLKMEAAMSYRGQQLGAIDSYIAIPNQLDKYMVIVENTGYQRTIQHCTAFRRPLLPDTVPLIGTLRDRLESEQKAPEL